MTDLVCYIYPGWEPRIRPAASKRAWMDATPERFAYRCLPLAVANAHGWEVLSPCGFSARWTGGSGTDAVEIRLDPGADSNRAPVSLFGQGTITLHIEGIFRTSEGWNLWVGGPPNEGKDGIAPLGGVIETDWSPYTFTMNWRFTRPGHWVRFEENEPFCFLFPVQRQALLDTEPKLRPIDEEPGLREAFESWSRSRDAFQKWVAETQPSAPADKWQKLYYRGVRPDGTPGPADHVSKLRLRPFTRPDSSAVEIPEPRTCPAAHAPPPGNVLLATTTAPPGDTARALSLGQFGRTPFRAGTAPLLQMPPPPADMVAEKRRDWILDVAERQRALSEKAGGIPRVADLSSEDFLDLYYAPGRPVIIEGAMAGWPALRWTPDDLKRKVGKASVEYQGGRDSSPEFELQKDDHKRRAPFDAFIDLIRQPGNDAYLTAYNSAANREALKVLDTDLGDLARYLEGPDGMIWIGPGGTFTPLHFDLTNNLIAQIVGTKDLLIAPPSETRRLYNHRHVFSQVHDLADPARLARFPLAKEARTFAVRLNPGDMIYMPVGWWHQVRARDFSATMTYTNFRWPNDSWQSFPGDRA